MSDGLLELLQDVINVLQSLKDTVHKPVFRKVGIFNNQIIKAGLQNDYSTESRVNNLTNVNDWPACFIEPVIDTVNTEGLGTQTLEGRLLIHICTYRLDTDKNWEYIFNLRTAVHQALHMLKASDDRYASLMRSAEQPDLDTDTLYNWIITYGFLCVDESASIYRNKLSGTSGYSITIDYLNSSFTV